MRFFDVLMMTIALLLLPIGGAAAQGAFGNHGPPHITARLIAESDTPAPGSNFAIAFDMTPAPGWHGYWLNPGDAGKGMEVRWTLPQGMSAGQLGYPVPQTLLIAGLMNHVYEGRYAVLTSLHVPRDARPGQRLPIRVRADWLACTDSICVPEGADLSLDLMVGNGAVTAARQAQFDGWRAALPRPLGGIAHFEQRGDKLRIAIPFPASAKAEAPYFFRSSESAKSYAAPQVVTRGGDALLIEIADPGLGKAVPAIDGVLRIGANVGLAVHAVQGKVPDAPATGEARTIMLALLGALLGGLLLNIMPCVFPILSLKAISLAKVGGDTGAAKREALAYAGGVVVTCMALGGLLLGLRAGGQSVGWAFQLQSPPVILLLCLVAWGITLNLAGVFMLQAVNAGDELTRKGGTHGAFWTGALVAFVATPWTGPFMAAALGAALVLPVAAALAVFAGLGLGLALPFLAIAYVPAIRRYMPKPGPWMKRLQMWLALPMALTVLALLWLAWRQGGADGLSIAVASLVLVTPLIVLYGLIQRRRGAAMTGVGLALLALIMGLWVAGSTMLPKGGAARDHGTDMRFGEAALAQARASGKPVFLYFTADWCLTCKVNEAAAIDRAEVRKAFADAGVVVMAGDWTNGDAAIGRFLNAQGRSGVPLYLWYAPGKAPQELPQILTPALLASLASGTAR